MRLRHRDGTVVHLSYGTNVHPAESFDGILAQLDTYAGPVRDALGWDRLGLGLWLAADVAATLAQAPLLVGALRTELEARGIEVVTLNAFPYRGFHDDVVKHAVYRPAWTDPARAAYTVDCARVLAALLPDDAAGGSISTLPLAWREPWSADAAETAMVELAGVVTELEQLDRPIRLAIEPEPGCVLDEVADAVRWLPDRVDPAWVGVCLDACHLAVSFADPGGAVDAIVGAGLAIPKIQASAAVQSPGSAAGVEALRPFAEPRYLHQARCGSGLRADDLPEALASFPLDEPWRVHFHVPLHAAPAPPLTSTTDVLEAVLDRCYGGDVALAPHVEVETYTWSVLPLDQRPDDDAGLVAGIAAELRRARELLLASGLRDDS